MRFFDAALKTLEDLDWSQLGSVGHWAKVCVLAFLIRFTDSTTHLRAMNDMSAGQTL
jgi:hypothetical protein